MEGDWGERVVSTFAVFASGSRTVKLFLLRSIIISLEKASRLDNF